MHDSRDSNSCWPVASNSIETGDVPTNPPGIVEMVTQKKVIATLFDPPEEARLRQTFNALFRQR